MGVTRPPRRAATRPIRPAGPVPPIWRWTWAAMGWTVLLLAIAWGGQRLEALARAEPQPTPCRIEWSDLPEWLTLESSASIRAALSDAAGLDPEDSAQDPDLCRRIGESLQSCPWVAKVEGVSKQTDGLIRVKASFREPFAFVEHDGKAYLVDRNAVRLPYCVDKPDKPELDESWNNWFRISGASGKLPAEGEAWRGDDLAAGLKLVDFLREATRRGEVTFRSSLRKVDVANFKHHVSRSEGELRIQVIPGNYYIQWGLPIGEEFGVEASAARKVENLRSFYAKFGQFDSQHPDVRNPDGMDPLRVWRSENDRDDTSRHGRQGTPGNR